MSRVNETKHAVILVAGEGKRLRPFTNSNPKCFACVAGKRILENALELLAFNGCQEVRIVTGHHAELIQETISEELYGMKIRYIFNSQYRVTNSMYSLALGLNELANPTWVLEGDVFLEYSILEMTASSPITWFVDSTTRYIDGAYIDVDSQGIARRLEIIRDLRLLQKSQSKSVGVLNLTEKGVRLVSRWLQKAIGEGRKDEYYDRILGDHLTGDMVSTVDVAGRKWFEIDTSEDLRRARQLFQ